MELKLDRLTKQFGSAIAVDRLSATLTPGVYGLLGANGAGKTTLMRMICDVLKPTSGSVVWNGVPIERLGERYRSVLGSLPQDFGYYPDFTALDFMCYLAALKGINRRAARCRSLELLETVGLADVAGRKIRTFSGGMKQRVVIAMALACNPKLLIADEPTTALDVTVQAQVLDLLKELRDKYGTAILLITHNLGVVWDMCDSVIVMYAGKTVEYAPCIDLYNHPLHPYTWGLLDCMPRLSSNSKEELSTIAGTPPDLRLTGVGCNFANRCPYAQERCRTEVPELTEVSPGHRVACHRQTGGNRLVRNEVTESGR